MIATTFGKMKTALEKIDSDLKLHHYKVRHFQPNISIKFERGHYIVKTAENGDELSRCLKLRYDVFHREYMNKTRTTGVDIDRLDEVCDHLMIIDRRQTETGANPADTSSQGKVVGTYRLNSSRFTDTFYSAGEFHIDRLLGLPGYKLELGRACIDKAHRNGVIIALLWRGIADYITATQTKVLFGCGSIKTMDPLEIGLITHYMKTEGLLTEEWGVQPTKKFKMKPLSRMLEYIEANPYVYNRDQMAKRLPPLFGSYLKANAVVAGEPALDREFRCIDFLTVLKVDEMNPLFKGKYKLDDSRHASIDSQGDARA